MGLPSRCLEDDTITALLERRLPAAEMRRVDGHLDECAECRALVATLADDVSCARLSEVPEVLEETAPDDAAIPRAISRRLGTTLKGKWTLETVLGLGGMAAVFKGRHRIGRIDAIKIVHRELAEDAEVCARFEREARAVNRLSHAGAVAIRDIDRTEDGAPFMVMEFLDGEPLSVAATTGVATERMLEVAATVLDVLADAHALGVIHRDIKPANIFLTSDGAVKLLDFGLARLRGLGERSQYTQAGQTLGTLAYMPPEQLKGEGVDHRSDIYAVGATMFRVLSGRHVHAGATTAADALIKIATEPAPSLADVAPEVSLDVCRVVDRALAFDPAERYPDAETMRGDVLDLLSGKEPSFALSWSSDDDDPDAEARELVGSTIGGYHLDYLIARGGMGGVYAATRGDEKVAVKVILAGMLDRGGDARARFRREIRAASRIQSQYVVEVVEAGIDDATGLPFYAMELVDGRDLSGWLEQAAPLEPQAVARIFLQACRGVRAAHERGIVHRDIKPANIMLTADAGELVVKLCDFGLAKTVSGKDVDKSQSLTHSGGMLGTPRYAAPEQATHAKDVDARADVWGLCISMHEALCGRKPWADCETLGQLIVAICTQDAPSLRQVAPWVDERFAELVASGLTRDPDERTLTLERLESELAAIAGDEPLTPSMMRAVEGSGYVARDDPSENVTVVRSVDSSSSPAPTRSSVRPLAAVVALVVVGAIGWVAWSAQAPSDDVVPTKGTAHATQQPSEGATVAPAPTSEPLPTAAVSVPAPSVAPASTKVPTKQSSSAQRGVPAPPAVPKGKQPPKPGGLDFHKTW